MFTGNGRAFTVGLDLKELGGETAAATVVNKDLGKAMLQVNKPIIGAINGYAITGGFELALMCDFMLASEQIRRHSCPGRCCTRMGTISAPTETNRHQPRKRAKPYRQLFGCCHGLHMGFGESRGGRRRTLATAQQLAKDIFSTEPVTRNAVRHIMDAGWHTSLYRGLGDRARRQPRTRKNRGPAESRRATSTNSATRSKSERRLTNRAG